MSLRGFAKQSPDVETFDASTLKEKLKIASSHPTPRNDEYDFMLLPAVLEINPGSLIQRMGELAPYANMLHVDIMDGKFVRTNNLRVFKLLMKCASQVDLELHLMVKEPARLFSDIRKVKRVKRIALQVESEWEPAFQKFKKYYEVGIGVKPETPIAELSNYRTIELSFLLLLSVTPGAQGNRFKPQVHRRIIEARKIFPKVPIEIDGGMNPERIKKLKKLGAKDFVVGSFLKEGDTEKKMKTLCRI